MSHGHVPQFPARFGPPPGNEVPWVEVQKGDWAYVKDAWWEVGDFITTDQIEVQLYRPDRRPRQFLAASVERWKKA